MRCVALGIALACAGGLSVLQGQEPAERGIYTPAQAPRGKSLYLENCGACHGPDLSGSLIAPPLNRELFVGGRRSFSQLFEYTQLFMPVFSPNGLSRQQTVDILAYALQARGFPAGSIELPAAAEDVAAVTLATAAAPSRR